MSHMLASSGISSSLRTSLIAASLSTKNVLPFQHQIKLQDSVSPDAFNAGFRLPSQNLINMEIIHCSK